MDSGVTEPVPKKSRVDSVTDLVRCLSTDSEMGTGVPKPVSEKCRVDSNTVNSQMGAGPNQFMAWCVVRHIQNLEKERDERAANALLRCSRSVCSTSTVPCKCNACRLTATRTEQADVQMDSGETPVGPKICHRCGHDGASDLCCQAELQPAKRCRTLDEAARVCGRAGERRRQLLNREVEAASLRPRTILAVEQARTPAQIALAKLRERIARK